MISRNREIRPERRLRIAEVRGEEVVRVVEGVDGVVEVEGVGDAVSKKLSCLAV